MDLSMLVRQMVAVSRDQSRESDGGSRDRPTLSRRKWSMAGFHVIAGASDTLEHIRVRKVSISDLIDALKKGIDDFMVQPSHIVFLGLIYPVAGIVLAAWTSGNNA